MYVDVGRKGGLGVGRERAPFLKAVCWSMTIAKPLESGHMWLKSQIRSR